MDKDKDQPLTGARDASFKHYCSCYPGGKPTYNLKLAKEAGHTDIPVTWPEGQIGKLRQGKFGSTCEPKSLQVNQIKEKKRHTVTLFVFLFFCYILINPNLYVSICWRPAFESLCTPLISDSSMTFAVFKQSHAATLLHAQNGSECLTTSHATLIVRFRCFFSRSCQDAKLYKESGHLVQTWRVYLRFMFFQH